jgi:NADH-quinone oxidoreductase subunit M
MGANLAGIAIGGGIIYGALVAWKQDDVKRLVAYSSVAHMGFVMLGCFAATQAGMEGAILQMLNHGISTGALFLLVGVIYDRRHTRLVREFGGLAKVMPLYAVLFVIVTMSSIGVPGTNGFVGEFMIIMGTFVSSALGGNAKLQAGLASAGVILAAVYMLSVVQRMFFGPLSNPKNKRLRDINPRDDLRHRLVPEPVHDPHDRRCRDRARPLRRASQRVRREAGRSLRDPPAASRRPGREGLP